VKETASGLVWSSCVRVAVVLILLATSVRAQTPAPAIPPEAQASPSFDPVRATNAYLATVPAETKARSDAYFEGGYWLQLWDFLYTAIALWLLLALGLSAWMRDRAERITRRRPLQTALYWTSLA
jgi:STE24 endopeptidase